MFQIQLWFQCSYVWDLTFARFMVMDELSVRSLNFLSYVAGRSEAYGKNSHAQWAQALSVPCAGAAHTGDHLCPLNIEACHFGFVFLELICNYAFVYSFNIGTYLG